MICCDIVPRGTILGIDKLLILLYTICKEGDKIYYVEFQGLRLVSVSSNLPYLCYRLLSFCSPSVIIRVRSYPENILLAVVHNLRIQYHFQEE